MISHIFTVILMLIVFVLMGQYTQETFNHKPLYPKNLELLIKRIGWLVATGWLIIALFNL